VYLEKREKLNLHKPFTLGAASRISGITPTSIIRLHHHILKNKTEAI